MSSPLARLVLVGPRNRFHIRRLPQVQPAPRAWPTPIEPRLDGDLAPARPAAPPRRPAAPPLPDPRALSAFTSPILLDAARRREAYDNRRTAGTLLDDAAFLGLVLFRTARATLRRLGLKGVTPGQR